MSNVKNAVVFLVIAILIYILYMMFSESYYDRFKKGGIITIATISKVNSDYKGRCQVEYFFKTKNAILIRQRNVFAGLKLTIKDTIINMKLPLIYQERNPQKCLLLLMEYDYKNLEIKFPDSLMWLNKFKKKW